MEIKSISKQEASVLLLEFHYLKDISKGFKSGYNFGLFIDDELKGVIIFTGFPVPELVVGAFGLDRGDQEGFFELSRLCLHPSIQGFNKNIASQFVSKSIKLLKRKVSVRAILSYADCDFHRGIVYQACNFKYYGKTTLKKDFWIKNSDGSYTKHSRGKTKGVQGEWRDRSQKHRHMLIYDKNLNILWQEESYP